MTKDEARKKFNVPEYEEIPDFVRHICKEQPILSEKQLEWARNIC